MGKFNTKRKAYFKKSQKLKQAKLNKEIAEDEKFSSDIDEKDMSDLEASDQGSDNEEIETQKKVKKLVKKGSKVEDKEDQDEESSEEDDMAEGNDKNNQNDSDIDVDVAREIENMPSLSKGRWKNKQRLLLIGSRGINTKTRHLIDDMANLLPHAKKDVKVNKQQGFAQLNEIAEIKVLGQKKFFRKILKKKFRFFWKFF